MDQAVPVIATVPAWRRAKKRRAQLRRVGESQRLIEDAVPTTHADFPTPGSLAREVDATLEDDEAFRIKVFKDAILAYAEPDQRARAITRAYGKRLRDSTGKQPSPELLNALYDEILGRLP